MMTCQICNGTLIRKMSDSTITTAAVHISVCHYGIGEAIEADMASDEILEMVEMAIKATQTCAFFGHEVVLNGLTKDEYNGIRGTLGGYVAENERRVVHPIAGSVVEQARACAKA